MAFRSALTGRHALGISLAVGVTAVLFWKLRPNPASASFERGRQLEAVKMTADARDAYLESVKRDPSFAPPYRALAELAASHGRFDVSAEYWRQYVARAPSAEHAYCRLAREEFRAGLEVPALADAERELRRDPKCARAHLVAGMLYTRTSQAKRALEHMAAAAEAYPDELPVQLDYARVLSLTSNWDRAEAALLRILERDRSHAEPFMWLGYVMARRPRTPDTVRKAKEYLGEALALNPEYPEAHFELARLLFAQREAARALPHAAKAAALRKHHPPGLYLLAQIYTSLGRSSDAAPVLRAFRRESRLAAREKALLRQYKLDPNNTAVALELGEVEIARERPEEALLFLRDAARITPEDSRIQAAIQQAERLMSSFSGKLVKIPSSEASKPPANRDKKL